MTSNRRGSLVIGFGGLSMSGKSHISSIVAQHLGWRRAAFGDRVRQIAHGRGLNQPSVQDLLSLGAELVEQDCEWFCRSVLEVAGWPGAGSVILDGIRHLKVLETIRLLIAPSTFHLVMVVAASEAREARFHALKKKHSERTCMSLREVDSHSTARDADSLRGLADVVFRGDMTSASSLQALLSHIRSWESGDEKSVDGRVLGRAV